MTKRILFVAMHNSIHTVRWIRQIADKGWDLHLFPVDQAPCHPALDRVTVHRPFRQLHPGAMLSSLYRKPSDVAGALSRLVSEGNRATLKGRSLHSLPSLPILERAVNIFPGVRPGESDKRLPRLYGPGMLAKLIDRLRPDLVHSMEFQHAGYNALGAKDILGPKFPPWLATNWGSDILYYRNFEGHRRQISRLLGNLDFYSCECERDVGLARELGLRARVMPVFPNTGGFDLEEIRSMGSDQSPSARKLIMVKGYQHFAGRALTALDAIEICADIVRNFRVVVFSATLDVISKAEQIRAERQLDISILPSASHDEMLRLYGQARMYMGISASDAISTAMLEAMAMGAFPIQTGSACADEWITDGESGYIVAVDNVGQIADRMRSALTDDALVDRAAALNRTMVGARLDHRILEARTEALYDEIFTTISGNGSVANNS